MTLVHVRNLQDNDVDDLVEGVARALARDSAHNPLITSDFDRETFAASLRASAQTTLVAVEDGGVVGHLYGTVLKGAAGREAWTGPDGWSGDADALSALRERAFDDWRERRVTRHHVWAFDDASRTGAWSDAGYHAEDVRGLVRLDDAPTTDTTQLSIRRGGVGDLDTALAFDAMIDVAHAHEVAPARVRRRALRELLEDPEVNYVVLEEDSRVLAQCLTFGLGPTRGTPASTLHVSAVAVAETARRRGLARGLVNHVLVEARAQGYSHAQVTWRRENAAADALWTALGFRRTYVRLAFSLS